MSFACIFFQYKYLFDSFWYIYCWPTCFAMSTIVNSILYKIQLFELIYNITLHRLAPQTICSTFILLCTIVLLRYFHQQYLQLTDRVVSKPSLSVFKTVNWIVETTKHGYCSLPFCCHSQKHKQTNRCVLSKSTSFLLFSRFHVSILK